MHHTPLSSRHRRNIYPLYRTHLMIHGLPEAPYTPVTRRTSFDGLHFKHGKFLHCSLSAVSLKRHSALYIRITDTDRALVPSFRTPQFTTTKRWTHSRSWTVFIQRSFDTQRCNTCSPLFLLERCSRTSRQIEFSIQKALIRRRAVFVILTYGQKTSPLSSMKLPNWENY
ncbi:hypothetical protein ABKN59_009611 [Abortiporus biennis]